MYANGCKRDFNFVLISLKYSKAFCFWLKYTCCVKGGIYIVMLCAWVRNA